MVTAVPKIPLVLPKPRCKLEAPLQMPDGILLTKLKMEQKIYGGLMIVMIIPGYGGNKK